MPTAPTPREQEKPPLSPQTLAWLVERPTPAARKLVYRVWATLTELQRSGHHPNPRALAALAAQLLEHQPSPRTGRCHACPRRRSWHPYWNWQHPHFPCIVWITTDLKLHGPFPNTRTHTQKSPPHPEPTGR